MHGTSLLTTPGQFGTVELPQVSKNDDKEHCFLKKFGFSDHLKCFKCVLLIANRTDGNSNFILNKSCTYSCAIARSLISNSNSLNGLQFCLEESTLKFLINEQTGINKHTGIFWKTGINEYIFSLEFLWKSSMYWFWNKRARRIFSL